MSEANYSKRSFDAVCIESACDSVVEQSGEAGQFSFYVNSKDEVAGIIACLPCAKDEGVSWGAIPFRLPGVTGASWEWNGNREKPTLSPSIHRVGHWHGWLRDGRFVSV